MIRGWLERRFEAKRAAEIANEPRLEFHPDAGDWLTKDGLGPHWRLSRGRMLGETLEGEPVSVPLSEFADRYLA